MQIHDDQAKQTAQQRKLAGQVDAYRRRHRLSQTELARAVNCSVSNVSRLLNGEIGMSAHFEDAFRNLIAPDDLTARQDELARIIAAMQPEEFDAVFAILHIMQSLRKS